MHSGEGYEDLDEPPELTANNYDSMNPKSDDREDMSASSADIQNDHESYEANHDGTSSHANDNDCSHVCNCNYTTDDDQGCVICGNGNGEVFDDVSDNGNGDICHGISDDEEEDEYSDFSDGYESGNEDMANFDDDDDDDQPDENAMVVDDNFAEDFVEVDPTGRYGRYAELLGKGAMKTVYRAYDMVDCKEVAWNKAKPPIEGPEEQAIAVRREIHLLQRLNHKGIIKLYSSWVDDVTGYTNFITELCSSTLLSFRLKHKYVSRKAVKCWGRQILKGLVHLHTQNPPIIHRDLKCENIFVKCTSNTTLKIGDFGSATVLDVSHRMHTVVGTPEFMAPEMYQEDYNELVDIYSFGMCMLELLTSECPYSECNSLAQIYKKITMGEKPLALQKIKDVQALQLISRCLLPASQRPSARELLSDPFLQYRPSLSNPLGLMKMSKSMPDLRRPITNMKKNNSISSDQGPAGMASSSPNLSRKLVCSRSPSMNRSYSVMGKWEDENTLHLKIRIQHSSASCDIDFPFDLRCDTPRSVALEMVRTFNYPECDVPLIADLIDKELAASVVELKSSFGDRSIQQDEEDIAFESDNHHETEVWDCEEDIDPAKMEQSHTSLEAAIGIQNKPQFTRDPFIPKVQDVYGSDGQDDMDPSQIEQCDGDLDWPAEVEGTTITSSTVMTNWPELDLDGYDSVIGDSDAHDAKQLLELDGYGSDSVISDAKYPKEHFEAGFHSLGKSLSLNTAEILRSQLHNWGSQAGGDTNTHAARVSDGCLSETSSHNINDMVTTELQSGLQQFGNNNLGDLDLSNGMVLTGSYLENSSVPSESDSESLQFVHQSSGYPSPLASKAFNLPFAKDLGPYSQEEAIVTSTSPSHQSSSSSRKFKQVPLGIGILLRPHSEQGLRRPIPLYVK